LEPPGQQRLLRAFQRHAVAIRKRCALAVRNIQIGFVQQRGRAKRDAGPPFGELAASHAVQLVVQRRKQLVGRGAIPLLGGSEERWEIRVHGMRGRTRLPYATTRSSVTDDEAAPAR
jgi:hypothetical protein